MSAAPRRDTRSWILALTASLIGLALALLVAEVMLRVLDLAPTGGLATVSQREFERLPGLFAPGQRVLDRELPQLPYRITIDSLGYRDATGLSRAKPAGEVRILLLGDSFTFGYLVDDDQTLPAQLERRLQSRCGNAVRVINAGVGGSSIETAARMAERALPLGIDAAVLTFTENDVTDLALPMWDQLASNRAAKSRFPMSVVYPAVRELALWNLLLKARAKWKARRVSVAPTVKPVARPAASDSRLLALRNDYRQRLLGLRQRLAGEHIPLLFAIYPSHLAVYQHRDEQVRWIEETAIGAGLATVNLTPALQRDGRSQEELYLLPLDGHPSPAGYAVVAPAIEDLLLTLPVVASRCVAGGRAGAAPAATTTPH